MDTRTHSDHFSEIASIYDDGFSALPVVVELRRRTHELVLKYFKPGTSVLELNCGTGEDALFMNNNNFTVIATDKSLAMLQVAHKKLRDEKKTISFMQLPFEQLSAIKNFSVDNIFSNFGGFNCADDITLLFEECYYVLRDNGKMIVCLMNPYSLWETFSFLFRGKFKHAFRRWKKSSVYVSVGDGQVLTWYHSIRRVKRAVKNKFTIQRVMGLNIITPPPGSRAFTEKHARFVRLLRQVEKMIDTLPFFSSLGDHYILVLERFE